MPERKLVIYQKGSSKPIVLTENSDIPIDELVEKVTSMVTSTEIHKIKTDNDFLIIKPNEIAGAMLNTQGEFKESGSSPEVSGNIYETDLVIDDE